MFYSLFKKGPHITLAKVDQIDGLWSVRYWIKNQWTPWNTIRDQDALDDFRKQRVTELRAVRFVLANKPHRRKT